MEETQQDIFVSSADELGENDVQQVKRGKIDTPLLIITLCLTTLGVVMIYSASSVVALTRFGDANYFLNGQLTGVALGLVALIVGMRLDYRWYQRLAYPILGLAFLLLFLVFIPGIGIEANNARRWLSVGPFSLQPSEIAKLSAVIYLAYSISKKDDKMKQFTIAFLPHVAVIGILVLLLMPQPDFGTSVILLVLLGMMLFLGGASFIYLIIFAIAGAFIAWEKVSSSPYRMERIQAYLDPEAYSQGIAWQINESFLALGAGGLSGLGLGEGHLKLGYVPELWNDFIATIIGHELGLIGLAMLVIMYLVFLWRGVHIALRSRDSFGTYLAFGITFILIFQAATNLGVVTGALPTKGLTLPFVSFGRTSIIVSLFSVGMLLNISQRNDDLWQAMKVRREKLRVKREMVRRKARMLANKAALRGKEL